MVNVYPLTVSRAVVHSGPRWQHWPHCGHTMWRCPVGRQAAWTVKRLPCPRWPNISGTWVRAAARALTSARANRNKMTSAGGSTTALLLIVIVNTGKVFSSIFAWTRWFYVMQTQFRATLNNRMPDHVFDYGSAAPSNFREMETNLQLATAKRILWYSSIC